MNKLVKIDRATRPKVVRFPEIKVKLTGRSDHIFNIIGVMEHAMRIKGINEDDVAAFRAEASAAPAKLIEVCQRWVEVT